MKILMIAPEPILEPRGTPISVYQRLTALSTLGHQVDLLTYPFGQDINIKGLTINRVPRPPGINYVKPGPSWTKFVLDILIFFKAILMLIQGKYDVIHTHEEASFMAIFLGKIFGIQHLYDMHSCLPQQLVNFKFTKFLPLISIFEFFEYLTIRSADAIITVGLDLENHVKSVKPNAKVITIENLPLQAIEGSASHIPTGKRQHKFNPNGKVIVLYSGTFEPYQGLDMLIESAEIVIRKHSDVFFVLQGGRHHQIEPLVKKTIERNIQDQFYFSGIIPIWEAIPFMENASILVSPRLDGTTIPLKIYTYMLAGKPIVATKTSGHEQILSDDVALLVPTKKEALADGIMRLISDPQLGINLGMRAKMRAEERYNPQDYLSKLAEIYRTLQPTTDSS